MKFNINDTVRVRLTDYGRAVLREDWHSTTNIYYARPEQRAIRGEYKPPKEDEHGWSEWQLWALMEAFGEHTGNGCRLSFETEIEIVGSEVAKAEAEVAALTTANASLAGDAVGLRIACAAIKAERDEARRMACEYEARYEEERCYPLDPPDEANIQRDTKRIAAERGWDCFDAKEAKP